MRCLIAISSCWDFEKNGNNDALRQTWLPDVKAFPNLEYKFFIGHGQGGESAQWSPECDWVFLPDVPDDYGHLTYKTRSSLRWALERDFAYVYRCFPDTYVRVDRLMTCGFERFSYYGDFRGDCSFNSLEHGRAQNYASGGPGYWLEKRAYELLVDAPVLGVWRDDITPYAEDLWSGNVLGRTFIGQLPPMNPPLTYFDDQHRFINHGSHFWPTKQNGVISSHLSCPERYTNDKMYRAHEAYLNS